ncbi:MAG: flagellar assembly protein FliW [Gemmatimonadaceae bacterium]
MTLIATEPRVAQGIEVRSELFGPLQVTDDQVLQFKDGIVGFAECTQWILIAGERPGTAWLQSIDVAALAFLLIDPFIFFDGFSVDISPLDVRRLRAIDATQLAVFAIVTFPAARTDVSTANLQGPIVINTTQRCGAQIVLGDGPWEVRHPFQLLSPAARS